MPQWILCEDGRWVNADHVRELRRDGRRRDAYSKEQILGYALIGPQGEQIGFTTSEISDATVIPAAPGWWAVEAYPEHPAGGGKVIRRTAVLGWRMGQFLQLEALTLEGLDDEGKLFQWVGYGLDQGYCIAALQDPEGFYWTKASHDVVMSSRLTEDELMALAREVIAQHAAERD